jgi:hypothetical protein
MRNSLIRYLKSKRLEILRSGLSEAENYRNNKSDYGSFLAGRSVIITIILYTIDKVYPFMSQLLNEGPTISDRFYWIVFSFITMIFCDLLMVVAFRHVVEVLSIIDRVSEFDSYKLRVEPLIESLSQSLAEKN